jgi:aspartate oxidase
MDSILRFVESNGMPGACLAAALGVAWWLAQNVAKPIVKAHVQFLEHSQAEQAKINDWLECHAESLKEMASCHVGTSRAIERLADKYDRLAHA